jgi:hypothetical protein
VTDTDDEFIEVVMHGLPLDVHRRTAEHQEELQREFQLISIGTTDHDLDVPKRLLDLIEALNERFQAFSQAPSEELEAALASGEPTLPELRYALPTSVADASIELSAMLDECDDYCRRGQGLLTLETPPEALAYRRWFLGEFVAQTRGLPPLSWSDADGDALIASPTLRGV